MEWLAAEYVSAPIDGVTISGGEPMEQAAALGALIDRVRQERDLSFVCYTGFTLSFLQRYGSPEQHALLERLDLLIDGPYVRARHTRKRWRGSDNQTVHFLTERHADWRARIEEEGDWIDARIDADGTLLWMGIPPEGFRERIESELLRRGIVLEVVA